MAKHLGNIPKRIIRDIAFAKSEALSRAGVPDKAKGLLRPPADELKNLLAVIRRPKSAWPDSNSFSPKKWMCRSAAPFGATRLQSPREGASRMLVQYPQAAGELTPAGEIGAGLTEKSKTPMETGIESIEAANSIWN